MSTDLISKIISANMTEEVRRQKLHDYYLGKQAILTRTMIDSTKPNNKIVHPYGNYITDTITGYFVGQPITYTADAPEYEPFAKELKTIFEYNDENAENMELAKDASRVGVAYELLYLDESADIRFAQLDAIHGIPIYSNTLENELIYFIRYYNDDVFDAASMVVEVYSDVDVKYYTKLNSDIKFRDATEHYFGMVPVAVYLNNQEELGDYETVVSLIDAYDTLNSDSVNDFEQFSDSYLALSGTELDEDKLTSMKQSRVLVLPDGGTAEWLVKNTNDIYNQNTIKNIDLDIHKFSAVPNMTDANFGNQLSAKAIQYKLYVLNNKISVKEANFKKGLQRRIELISNILDKKGTKYDYLTIDINFHLNLPVDELERINMANAASGLVSDETILSLLPFVTDPAKEIKKRDAQMDINVDEISNSTENSTPSQDESNSI